ncbi:MAG: DUF1801 domain-containing protein [Bacteroidota bacterium]|nr:DUF1801 domain-containing protein [Bacteroidota bacterium]
MAKLRKVIKKNIPAGFKEGMGYGMLCYSVPHSLYPNGYHCDPKQPLPFLSLASQKNNISLYHMGLNASTELLKWFTAAYPEHSTAKLDMGKSCIRFKKTDQIPYDLIGELVSKMPVKEWISLYEKHLKK